MTNSPTRSPMAPARLESCQRCGATAPTLALAEPRRPIHADCGGRIRFRLLSNAERSRIGRVLSRAQHDRDVVALTLSGVKLRNGLGIPDPTGELAARYVDDNAPTGPSRPSPPGP